MSLVIAVMNQKGGVGKTTTAVNLAHALALSGKRVLALDLDPQAHLTLGFGTVAAEAPGMDKVLLEGEEVDEVLVQARNNLDLLPAGPGLANMEHVTAGGVERGMRLRKALQCCDRNYDAVVMDCPPSAGLLGMNALFATQEVLIPISSDYLALQSLAHFMVTLRFVEDTIRRPMTKRVVLTRYQGRRRLAREVREKLQEHFPNEVLTTSIRENVALAECPSFGETIFEYEGQSHGAEDYRHLANELLHERQH
jgi:chromosome partitioning protein